MSIRTNISLLISSCLLCLSSCQQAPEVKVGPKKTSIPEQKNKPEDTLPEPPLATRFLIDHCEVPYISLLERDIAKGNDSCILKIKSKERNIKRVEVLNIPVDKSSIQRCEEDYVSVSFACGGPCHSNIFVFVDENRPSEQYSYVQHVEGHPNIIAHIQNEEFEKMILRNLENGKELEVANPDINLMDYGKMDTLYLTENNLNLEYQTSDEATKKKVVSLSEILK